MDDISMAEKNELSSADAEFLNEFIRLMLKPNVQIGDSYVT